jgi:hypothetical protein
MSSEEDKPPAPPVRLTSNRGGSDRLDGPPDLKPLPKGNKIVLESLKRGDLLTAIFSLSFPFHVQSPTTPIAKRKR